MLIVTYYAGFAWKERGKYKSQQEWENYLAHFARKLNSPLKVTVSGSSNR